MSAWMKLALGLAVAAVVSVILATVVVGSKVREETVVARPYEEGLQQHAERTARAMLGLAVAVEDETPAAGAAPLAFRLSDREGRPVEGAQVAVEATRPETSRGAVRAEARETAPGRYAAALALPAPGPWDVRFDVRRGADRVRLERRLTAGAPCALGEGPCTRRFPGGGDVTLELAPRPLRTMTELAVAVTVRDAGAPAGGASVAFAMPGMDMGRNEVRLAARGPGRFEGTAVLVRCPSGRRDWEAVVAVAGAGEVRFPFSVAE